MTTTTALDRIGVGIDTARYGHRASFLGPDLRPVAKPLTPLPKTACAHGSASPGPTPGAIAPNGIPRSTSTSESMPPDSTPSISSSSSVASTCL